MIPLNLSDRPKTSLNSGCSCSKHVVVQHSLVAFQRHDVIGFLVNHLLRDLAVTVERITGHDAALKAEHSQQLGDRHGLVRLGIGRDLADAPTAPRSPRPRAYAVPTCRWVC